MECFNRYPQWAVFCGKVTTKEKNKELLMNVVSKGNFLPF